MSLLVPSVSLQYPWSHHTPSVNIPSQLNFPGQFHHQFNVASAISFAPPPVHCRFYHQFCSTFFGLHIHYRSHSRLNSTFNVDSTSISFAPTFLGLIIYHQSQSCLNSTFNVNSTIHSCHFYHQFRSYFLGLHIHHWSRCCLNSTFNHSSQVPVIGGVKVGGVTNSTTKLDRFERVRVIERNEISNQVWMFRHQP